MYNYFIVGAFGTFALYEAFPSCTNGAPPKPTTPAPTCYADPSTITVPVYYGSFPMNPSSPFTYAYFPRDPTVPFSFDCYNYALTQGAVEFGLQYDSTVGYSCIINNGAMVVGDKSSVPSNTAVTDPFSYGPGIPEPTIRRLSKIN